MAASAPTAEELVPNRGHICLAVGNRVVAMVVGVGILGKTCTGDAMDAIECLKTRRSVRVYQDQPVARDVIEDIVDCGRLAATAINVQPWQFVVVQDAAMRSQIADTTDHGKFIADAPVCIAVFCLDGKYYLEDGCAATQNILNGARAHGLGSCWIAGDKKPYAGGIREMLGVPEGYRLISLITLGYPAQEGHRAKKSLSEVLHWERF